MLYGKEWGNGFEKGRVEGNAGRIGLGQFKPYLVFGGHVTIL
jgi:hypothetical protein